MVNPMRWEHVRQDNVAGGRPHQPGETPQNRQAPAVDRQGQHPSRQHATPRRPCVWRRTEGGWIPVEDAGATVDTRGKTGALR